MPIIIQLTINEYEIQGIPQIAINHYSASTDNVTLAESTFKLAAEALFEKAFIQAKILSDRLNANAINNHLNKKQDINPESETIIKGDTLCPPKL